MAWTLVNKTPNTNLGYSYYPAVWEDSGKVYVKAQGELDLNIYDISTDTWATLALPTTNAEGRDSTYYVESCPLRQELMWVSGGYLYWLLAGHRSADVRSIYLDKLSITTGQRLSSRFVEGTLGALTAGYHGNWGRNRHKAVIKEPVSGRIFLICFYMKQVYEFLPATETLSLVKTWTESIGGNATDDIAGCDAVATNGMIYLMGMPLYNGSGAGGSAGPVEINIADWTSSVKAAYPDFGYMSGKTYNFYCDTVWTAIGNSIVGYGGQMRGAETPAGDSSWDVYGSILREIQFNPSDNTWSDLGTIPASFLFASAIAYGNSGYLFGGYESGAATQKTGNLIYLLVAIDTMALAFDPSDGSVTVTWTDTSGQALTGYLVERREQQGSVWTTVGAGAAADRTMIDNTAVLGHDFYYRVRPYFVQVS